MQENEQNMGPVLYLQQIGSKKSHLQTFYQCSEHECENVTGKALPQSKHLDCAAELAKAQENQEVW